MAKHFTAVISITKVNKEPSKKIGYDTIPEIDEKKEIAHIVVRASSLEALIIKASKHMELEVDSNTIYE